MKPQTLKTVLLIVGISILSGCYTQLSEPVYRQEYYTEADTVYEYTENEELSDYNLGYRDGYRDFLNDYLWYGYNPDSYFYNHYRSYWYSPYSHHYHSFYLGYYDPFFYDPFWDWGYYGYYHSPYSYYRSGYWYRPYYADYYYHGYYRYRPYYYGYVSTKKESTGREQLTAERQTSSPSLAPSSASRSASPKAAGRDVNDLQTTMNMPVATGGGSTGSDVAERRNGSIPSKINSNEVFDANRRTPVKEIPGFQTTLNSPTRPDVKPFTRTSYGRSQQTEILSTNTRTTRTRTVPRSGRTSRSDTKSISRSPKTSGSSSSSSSQSTYSSPSTSRSSSSSSSSSSSVRSSSGSRSSSSSSSSRSGSSSSSGSRSSAKRSSNKK